MDNIDKKFLEDIQFYTSFLDKKVLADLRPSLRFISSLYSKFLQFRVDHGFYSLRAELWPFKLRRKIQEKLFVKSV